MRDLDLSSATHLIPEDVTGKPTLKLLLDSDVEIVQSQTPPTAHPKRKRDKQEWRGTTTMGLVYYLGKDGRRHYHGRLKIRGKLRREALKTTKLSVARERFRKWRDKLEDSVDVEEGTCLDSLFDSVLEQVKIRKGGSIGTYECYKECVQRLRTHTPEFIKTSLANLDATEDVAPALSVLDGKYAGNTINNVLSVLYLTLDYAVSRDEFPSVTGAGSLGRGELVFTD